MASGKPGHEKPARKIKVRATPEFIEAFKALKVSRPAIKDKHATFVTFKTSIPPKTLPAGMSDHELGDRLMGYRECHLAGDVLLIYTLRDDELHELLICTHDELKGGRERALAKRLRVLKEM